MNLGPNDNKIRPVEQDYLGARSSITARSTIVTSGSLWNSNEDDQLSMFAS